MNKNQVIGRVKQAQGKIKEVIGKVTDDKTMEVEGKFEKHGGNVEAKYGDIKNDTRKSAKSTAQIIRIK